MREMEGVNSLVDRGSMIGMVWIPEDGGEVTLGRLSWWEEDGVVRLNEGCAEMRVSGKWLRGAAEWRGKGGGLHRREADGQKSVLVDGRRG